MEDMREEAMRIMREMDEEMLLEWMRWVRENADDGGVKG